MDDTTGMQQLGPERHPHPAVAVPHVFHTEAEELRETGSARWRRTCATGPPAAGSTSVN